MVTDFPMIPYQLLTSVIQSFTFKILLKYHSHIHLFAVINVIMLNKQIPGLQNSAFIIWWPFPRLQLLCVFSIISIFGLYLKAFYIKKFTFEFLRRTLAMQSNWRSPTEKFSPFSTTQEDNPKSRQLIRSFMYVCSSADHISSSEWFSNGSKLYLLKRILRRSIFNYGTEI